jgi:tetratricopeptide (TPR) repeat protein
MALSSVAGFFSRSKPMALSLAAPPALKTIQDRVLSGLLLILASAHTWCGPVSAQDRSSRQPNGVTIEGTVRDSGGAPIAGATVLIEDKGGARLVKTTTNADGSFVVSPNHAGTFSLRAEKSTLRTAITRTVSVAAGESAHVDLVLLPPEGASAAGSHPAPNAAPAPGGAMELKDEPNFTVAGVTDWSNVGLHGSDTNSRTSDALAKDTLTLTSGVSERASSDAPAHKYDAGLECSAKGDFAKAREQVRRALASGDDAEGHRLLGDLDERLGDPLEAVREYERAARMYPSEQNYFDWGTELLLHKAAQPAVEVFTMGSARHPKSARMLAGLGAALYASGSYDDAAQRLCEASDLRPSDPAPYLFLGKMEKTASAPLPCGEEKLARFAKEQPANALANYYYGLAVWKGRRGPQTSAVAQQTETLIEKAVKLDPKLGEGWVQLGILYSERGDLDQAILSYKKAIEASPELGDAHYRLSLAYKRIGEEAKAHEEFQAYQRVEETETAAVERQRRELRQFLVILKDQPAAASPH